MPRPKKELIKVAGDYPLDKCLDARGQFLMKYQFIGIEDYECASFWAKRLKYLQIPFAMVKILKKKEILGYTIFTEDQNLNKGEI